MEQSDKDIKEAHRHLKSISITKKDVTLKLKDNSTLLPTLKWLNSSLTDAVLTVTLILRTQICYHPDHDEILSQIAASRKKINIFMNCWDYPMSQQIKVTIKEHRLSIFMEYDSSKKFTNIPPDLRDALSNGGNIPQEIPFRTITAEKNGPKTSFTITGIKFINEVIEVNDDCLEFLSKLPNLKNFEFKWIPNNPTTKLLVQYLSNNASGLEELTVNGVFSDQMIASVNTIVSQCRRLKRLAICRRHLINFEVISEKARVKKANLNPSEPSPLVLPGSIQELNIKCCSDQIKLFIEPLRHNRTITSLTIDLGVLSESIYDAEELVDVISERPTLKKLEIGFYSKEEQCTYLLETALENKNITCLNVRRGSDSENFGDNCIKLLMANPYLVELSDSKYDPEELQQHIAANRLKREAMQIDLITILYNMARTFDSGLNYLPKEMWCTIMSYYEYPGIDQPFGDVLHELFMNSIIRRVIREL